MAYYLEIKFSGANEPWQRNPNPFPTMEAAFSAGLDFCAARQYDPKAKAEMWQLTRDKRYTPETKNVNCRVVDEANKVLIQA